jgi:hypothetical protein
VSEQYDDRIAYIMSQLELALWHRHNKPKQ